MLGKILAQGNDPTLFIERTVRFIIAIVSQVLRWYQRVQALPHGSYVITPSAATSSGLGNYTISYVNGVLTVTPAVVAPSPQPGVLHVADIGAAAAIHSTIGVLPQVCIF